MEINLQKDKVQLELRVEANYVSYNDSHHYTISYRNFQIPTWKNLWNFFHLWFPVNEAQISSTSAKLKPLQYSDQYMAIRTANKWKEKPDSLFTFIESQEKIYEEKSKQFQNVII